MTDAARLPPPAGYLAAVAMTGLAALAALLLEQVAPAPNLSLLFVLPVVISALALGIGPALASVAAGVLAYNFFLIEPRHTLHVADPANGVALALLLVVAMLVSGVAAEARRRTLEAMRSADQAEALNALSRELVGAADLDAIARACADALSRLFEAPALVLVQEEGGLQVLGRAGDAGETALDLEAAGWCVGAGLATRGGAYPVEDAAFDFWPVVSRQRRRAAIGLRISSEEGRPAAPERLVEIVGGYLAVAMDREALAAEATAAQVREGAERVKSDLLAAVSHDLKTPLATILLSVESLRRLPHDPQTQADMLEAMETEARRLDGMVANLLDLNRIEAGAVAVQPTPTAPADLVAQALHSREAVLRKREVTVEVDAGARPLLVDPALFGAALGNVLENAVRHGGEGAIAVRGGEDGDTGWIEVQDHGPGFPLPVEAMFERFARGAVGDGRAPGTGLGLSIARALLEAQGGRVEARNAAVGGGACVRLTAPLAEGA